jgi:hypothetical protein
LVILSDVLAPIRFNFKVSVLTDVGKVGRDSADLLAASGDFDHDFRGAPTDGSADLLDLRGGEAAGLRRTHPSAAEQIQVGPVSERYAKGVPTHRSGSPRP